VRWDLTHPEAETVASAKVTLGLLLATNPDVILDRSFLSMWAYASRSRSGASRSGPYRLT
jgi:hypothetical protein